MSLNEFTSDTCVLPGAVVPVTVTGSEKFVGKLPPTVAPPSVLPLLRLPRVPGSIADCRLVLPDASVDPSGRVGAV